MGRKTGRRKRGLLLSPHQHMPTPIAWQAWRMRREKPRKTMGQIAQLLRIGDPKNPTQIKRYVANCTKYLKTPGGQALLQSEAFITGTVSTFTYDLDQAITAADSDRKRRRIAAIVTSLESIPKKVLPVSSRRRR